MKYPSDLRIYFINSSGRKMSSVRFDKLKTLLNSFDEVLISRSSQWGSGVEYRVEFFRLDYCNSAMLKLIRKDDKVVPENLK